jgi:hypothetical protein
LKQPGGVFQSESDEQLKDERCGAVQREKGCLTPKGVGYETDYIFKNNICGSFKTSVLKE